MIFSSIESKIIYILREYLAYIRVFLPKQSSLLVEVSTFKSIGFLNYIKMKL